MTWVHWLGWVLSILLALMYISYGRHTAKRESSLEEYAQFLLFHPKVYRDHRAKYLTFLKEQRETTTDVIKMTMVASKALDNLAEEAYDKILLANVTMRNDPSRAEQEE